MDTLHTKNHEYILWILLASSTLHMVEEYAFDWPAWAQTIGIQCSNTDMFVMNMSFMVIGICAAAVGWRAVWFGLSFPMLMLINCVFHILATIISDRLNPGLLTDITLILPIGIACFILAARDGLLTKRRVGTAFATGLVIHLFPLVIILMRKGFSY